MKRRDFLRTGSALLAASAVPFQWVAAAQRRPKVLYFTRCAGFVHSVVNPGDDGKSHSQRIMEGWAAEHNVELVCTKDGRIFDDAAEIDSFDVIAFYTSGDLTKPGTKEKTPPMSADGKKRLLDTIAGGKGFVGFHAATDTFRSGPANEIQDPPDPYIAMIGGEFVKHGPQQAATMRVTSPGFPGLADAGRSFALHEEWYALKNFAADMHVILVQETEGMEGNCYQRPPFPATWARQYGEGRVFYTSLGHREDVWTNPLFKQIALGGFGWAGGGGPADLPANLSEVAPGAGALSPEL